MTGTPISQPEQELPAGARGRTLARGVAWVGVARWSSQVLTWVVTLVVVRILSPRDYGIVGMTTFFIILASVLAESGIGSAIVALRDLTPQAIRQLNVVAVGMGLGGFGLSALAAWPTSRYFREPALVPVMIAFGATFVFDGFRVVPVALLNRELNYRGAAGVDFVRAVAAAVTILALALRGAGYWSLVGGTIAGSAAASLWTLRLKRTAWERPDLSVLAGPLRFCKHLILGRLAYNAYQSSDFMIAGRLFGPGPLGQYNLAWMIASLPGEKLTAVIVGAITPFFAAIQHDPEALAAYYLQITRFLSLVIWPVLFGFLVIADLVIPQALGARWSPAVPITRALLVYAALQSISLGSVILNVTGRSRAIMQVALLALVVLPPSFYLGGKLWGPVGIAWAWTVIFPMIQAWNLAMALDVVQIPFRVYLGVLRRPALLVVTMCGVVALFRYFLPVGVSALGQLVLSVAVGAASYALLCFVFAKEDFASAIRIWRTSRKPLRSASPAGLS